MRFALIATTAAAAAIIPFALHVSQPQMTSDQFVGAVRCAAYEIVLNPTTETSAARYRLNAEARRQPASVTVQAHAEASTIAHQAQAESVGELGAARAAACAL